MKFDKLSPYERSTPSGEITNSNVGQTNWEPASGLSTRKGFTNVQSPGILPVVVLA
jgi:hypothetical protein